MNSGWFFSFGAVEHPAREIKIATRMKFREIV